MERATLESFLAPISKQLGHDQVPEDVTPFDYKKEAPARLVDGLSHDALVEMFAAEAEKIRVDVRICTKAEVAAAVADIVGAAEEAGSVVFADDARIDGLAIPAALEAADKVTQAIRWDASQGREAVAETCNAARFGITYTRGGIAETGTVVQPCSEACGRAISLLPLAHIALVDADSIKATLGDWMKILRDEGGENGAGLPAQVCFISGPSVTSDIELVRVEGVHGPMYVHYIIING